MANPIEGLCLPYRGALLITHRRRPAYVLFVAILFALITTPAHSATLTATIRDAWWSNQTDADGDNCFEGNARLNWDPDVAGGTGTLTVFERFYYKSSTSTSWIPFNKTTPHTITNATTADQQFIVVPLDNGACLAWDYKIEIYRTNAGGTTLDYIRSSTNDIDLANHHEEAPCDPKAVVVNAWWSNQTDADGNGCFESTARLNWDANVSCGTGSLTNYERIFFRLANSTNLWILAGTNPTHVITGTTTNDAQYIDLNLDGGACLAWDYKIEVETLRNGIFVTDSTYGPTNALSVHREEAPPCVATVLISSTWWTNRVDTNNDGCFEDSVQLCWDPDETCGKGQSVFEKIYFKPSGNPTWELYCTTLPHWIVNASTEDQQTLAFFFQNPLCQDWDYKIELYRLGQSVPDDIHDPGNDPILSGQPARATQPVLGLTQSGNKVILSWATNWVGFTLQTSSNLATSVWTTNSPLPVVTGSRYTTTNTITPASRFYRLKK